MDDAVGHVDVDWAGRPVRIEHAWIAPGRRGRPLFVFLHEGLGSLAMWKDFPRTLCDALDVRGLVFSRPRNGRSTAVPRDERWDVDYMHRAAREGLPAFFAAVGLDTRRDPPWLFGHSDGASIALLHAAACPDRVAGLVVLAPHLFVETVSLESIAATRQAYLETDLKERLARYHDDVDAAFWGWNDIWLHPPFRAWNIEEELTSIRAPVLAVQGRDDEYGTLAQVEAVAKAVPGTRVVVLDDCRHSPHKDQPARLVEEVARFFELPGARRTGSSNHRHTATTASSKEETS
ncbi:MAG: alpha/beta hydrolase [Burkholderiales bacterium]|nr:alpha/beta hydrolase [Burkholderiales bacterium]GIK88158.1 MAG: alpha/beta hydrolase [Betaproteobacteria bacterium]